LTIWQLATGKPQHLPHLTAAIESVVVSPSGSSYALSLANNSVIVISTTELEAKTNIVGIQTRRVDAEQLPKETKSGKPALYALQPVPIAVDSSNTQQVLFTVPASQPRQSNEGLRPEPYLQTFDIANQRPVDRQALTRNNATDPNMGPEGERIKEPNVKHIQVSYDGQWLATIDEWIPPRADTAFLDEGNTEFTEEQRLLRREVYLKIWRRDEKNGQWTLETRIDAPHFLEDVCGNGRVLDLVAHPKEHSFATIGEDQVVRTWKPKTRLRDGIVVRGADNRGLVNWSLHRSIPLPDPDKVWLSETTIEVQHSRTSRLAFSPDGSVLAAGVSGTSESDRGLVHLIDTDSATIRRSMTEIDTTVLCGLGIVGRYLVVVTDSIVVWDLVYDDLVYCASISTTGVDSIERTSVVRLATNQADGTFAVSLPQFEKNDNPVRRFKKALSKIAVYGTEHKEPLWSHTVPGITLGLTARRGAGERGYIALDSVSCIRIISPAAGSLALPMSQKFEEAEAPALEEDSMEDVEEAEEGTTSKALADLVLENEYDKPVVTQQDLEEIFHNDGAPQAPKDVFSAVLRLFGGVAKAAA
jgi:NET1-associated nuclear protein 1 (U3 small nucleolar RNA-associated protein 17)